VKASKLFKFVSYIAIDNDNKVSIEKFEYDPKILNPHVKAYSGRFLIHGHGDTLKIGKSRIGWQTVFVAYVNDINLLEKM
jgi:hypothetical protein